MTLPMQARVEAAPNFLTTLADAKAFLEEVDMESAPRRYAQLQSELREMVKILQWSPASGRPARFMAAGSAQARLRAQSVFRLAQQAGLPSLREFILDQYVVLYAHAETLVVLLALKHQRQFAYQVA
jgi:hypothetical protein